MILIILRIKKINFINLFNSPSLADNKVIFNNFYNNEVMDGNRDISLNILSDLNQIGN